MSKGGSPPAPPDYVGAAKAQGAANVDAAKIEGKINNPNVISPYGSQTVQWGAFDQAGYDQQNKIYTNHLAEIENQKQQLATNRQNLTPEQIQNYEANIAGAPFFKPPDRSKFESNTEQPTITQTLSHEQQALYNQQVGNQQGLGSLANQGIDAAKGIIGSKLDYSGVPAAPGDYNSLRSSVYDAMMARPNEDIANNRDNTNSDLIAAGIRPGSKAYGDKMNLINRQENDARMQAIINAGNQTQQAYGMDMQSRQQGLAEQLAQRQVPLNEITALMSGSQVSNPFQMPGYSQNNQVAPAPIYDANMQAGQYNTDMYNAQQGAQSANNSGLYGLGGAAIAGGLMF